MFFNGNPLFSISTFIHCPTVRSEGRSVEREQVFPTEAGEDHRETGISLQLVCWILEIWDF